MGDTYTTVLLLVHQGEPFVGTRETRSHMQPGKQPRGYRKAEIDNAGGPPAPYPNLDTRPAPAPGSSRRDPALLPSVSTIFAHLYVLLRQFPLTRFYYFSCNLEELLFLAIKFRDPFFLNFFPVFPVMSKREKYYVSLKFERTKILSFVRINSNLNRN